jgi:hypothetical protein
VLHRELNWPYLLVSMILVQAPAIYLMTLLGRAEKPEEFGRQSLLLKILIFLGMASVLFLA